MSTQQSFTTEPFDSAALQTDLFIAGRWLGGKASGRFAVVNPADGTVVADVADGSKADAVAAVDAAQAASGPWSRLTPRQRGDILLRCHELMLSRREWFARLIALENGKAMADARGEVSYAAEFFRWYAEEGVRSRGSYGSAPIDTNKILVSTSPIGIAVLVTPWNFPAAMATRKIAPALAAGCTCVLKPAAETPLTALAIAALMSEAGVPDGVVNVVTTTQAAEVVNAMLQDSRVRKLSFTGSTQVGRVLLREAAQQVLSCSMELGGNAPFIVFDDACLDKAVSGAMVAKMRNGGQACTAANRFYVQNDIFDAFCNRLVAEMSAVKVGPASDPDVQCGPLITRAAVEKITRLIDTAVADGARLLLGGKAQDATGYFFPPTVLVDVPAGAAILQEEIFGPVAVLVRFETEEEVIRLANGTEYGLVSYVFTEDMAKALRISECLESGMVGLNRGLVSEPAAPFGGVKQSGLGREGGHHGLAEYQETRYIALSL